MTIIAKVTDQGEKTLKSIKVISYVCGMEASNKPSQINMALEMLQNIMDNTSDVEFLKLIKKNGN